MIQIAIVDDHPMVRRGLTHLFCDEGWSVTLEAGTADEALRLLPITDWDVCVLDQVLPDKDGIDVLRELRQRGIDKAVLMHSTLPADSIASRVYKLKGNGFINKSCDPDELLRAIRQLFRRQNYVSPEFASKLLENLKGAPLENKHETLSDREYQVLCALAYGKSLTEISKQMDLTPNTVSTYRSRILAKLDLANNIEIARYAMEHRLITPS